MNLFDKLTKRKPDTILGKLVTKNKEHISYLSFVLYFIPFIILILTHDAMNGEGTSELPVIYTFMFIWYFIALGIVGSIKRSSIKSQIIEMVVCLPVYASFVASYLVFRLFTNKDKHPDVTEDKLPLHQRKIKLKRIVRKTKRKKLWVI